MSSHTNTQNGQRHGHRHGQRHGQRQGQRQSGTSLANGKFSEIVQYPKQGTGWQHSRIVFGKGHSCINKLQTETNCRIVAPKFSEVREEHKRMFPFFYIEGATRENVLDASVKVMKLLMTSMSRERHDLIRDCEELTATVDHQKLQIAEGCTVEYRPTSPTYDAGAEDARRAKKAEIVYPAKKFMIVAGDEDEDEDEDEDVQVDECAVRRAAIMNKTP